MEKLINLSKIREKMVIKTKWVFVVYGQLIISLVNGLTPSQTIGLPICTTTPAILRLINSNVGLSKKSLIAQVIQQILNEIDVTEREMDQLYHLLVKCRNNSLSQLELIMTLINLRGGLFVDITTGF